MNNNLPNADLAKIVKRLGLIKTLISLEETEDIAEQVSKLSTLSGNNAINKIVDLLKQQAYGKAVRGVEFDPFMYEAGINAFTLSPSKWIESTHAKGLITRQENNGIWKTINL